MTDKRTVYKVVDGKEIKIAFTDIKKGTHIKIYEDNSPLSFNGKSIFVPETDAYLDEEGLYSFQYSEGAML